MFSAMNPTETARNIITNSKKYSLKFFFYIGMMMNFHFFYVRCWVCNGWVCSVSAMGSAGEATCPPGRMVSFAGSLFANCSSGGILFSSLIFFKCFLFIRTHAANNQPAFLCLLPGVSDFAINLFYYFILIIRPGIVYIV